MNNSNCIASVPKRNYQKYYSSKAYFKEKAHKIEAKNSELKHRHGYDISSGSGLVGMHLQAAVTMFTVNLKRIMKLSE